MRPTVTIGRPFGIPVGLHWSLFVLGALASWSLAESFRLITPTYPSGTYWTVAVLVVLLYGVALLAHELAHAVVARRHGLRVERITLWVMGGLAELGEQPTSASVELRIALAGPAASLVASAVIGIGALAAHTFTDAGVLTTGLAWLALINAALAVLNLLPARPLDGGRVLTALLWWQSRDPSVAAERAARVSLVVGWLMQAAGIALLFTGHFDGLWIVAIGWFVGGMARAERQLHALRRQLQDRPVRQVMGPPPPHVPAWTPVSSFATDLAAHPAPLYVVTTTSGTAAGVVDPAELRHALLHDPEAPVSTTTRPLTRFNRTKVGSTVGAALAGTSIMLPVLVVDGGRVVGLVTINDLVRATLPLPPSPWPPPSGPPVSYAPPREPAGV